MYTPGYGDEATWGPCEGHPNDPRTDSGSWDDDEEEGEEEEEDLHDDEELYEDPLES